MAGCCRCCVTYLFFSYLSGAIIYLILAIFAQTGNVTLLVEHYKQNKNETITDEERKSVKDRTARQYFMAFAISFVLTLILYFFGMRGKKEKINEINRHKSLDLEYKPEILYQPENEINTNTNNLPIELGQENNNQIIKSINTTNSIGMGENEI